MPYQPSLFPAEADDSPGKKARAAPGDARPGGPAEALEARYARLRRVADGLPPGVRFGTSSWSFPGWRGLVYASPGPAARLSRDGLREYARHPLFGTVGVDRSYYAPVPDEDFRRYTAQLPAGFPCCCKAPARVTSALQPGRGSPAPNPDFLSADRLAADLLEPVGRAFRAHAGPFILQFPPLLRRSGLDPGAFVDALDRFLDCLPRDFQYAVEVRDRPVLGGAYARALARHGVAHVYTAWTAMPLPGDQAGIVPVETMPFVMVRLLLRPGSTYAQQRDAFAPFDRLVAPDEPMRAQVVDLVGRGVAAGTPACFLVDNKAEGSAPLTIEALAERLVTPALRPAPPRPPGSRPT
jgi:uncharacterized protein YecE (DUF72 family)